MNILIMGPQGAGKGTQSDYIVAKYGLTHLATGSIFREEVKNETALGQLVKTYINAGQLVPDEVTVDIVKSQVTSGKIKNGFILDGFPRNIEQAQALDVMLKENNIKLDVVINLQIDIEKSVKRIAGRRVCKVCGTNYNIDSNPSKVPGICDKCGGALYQREDEDEESVRARLNIYTEKTKPLEGFYLAAGLLKNVEADQSIEQVFHDISSILDGYSV